MFRFGRSKRFITISTVVALLRKRFSWLDTRYRKTNERFVRAILRFYGINRLRIFCRPARPECISEPGNGRHGRHTVGHLLQRSACERAKVAPSAHGQRRLVRRKHHRKQQSAAPYDRKYEEDGRYHECILGLLRHPRGSLAARPESVARVAPGASV